MKRTIYLIGPVSGLPDCNRPAFRQVADELRRDGAVVITPFDRPDPDAIQDALDNGERAVGGVHWQRVMRHCIAECLPQADQLVALPGWQQSRGAVVEAIVAVTIGIPVRDHASGELVHLHNIETSWYS